MLHIYNTLARTKQPLQTVEPGKVRMYVCGMTVYDYCHLGHARMLVSFDVVQRWLRASGYEVTYVRNITDIDDKIIRRAVETGRRMQDVTDFYIEAMHADEHALGVESPTHEPRATQYVGQMLNLIGRLEEHGLAYRADDGDVNYAVRKFPGYGKLSGRSLDELRAGERVAVDASKRDPFDFVLWKSAKDSEPAESKWESPYGLGRPGWHIECSAMSEAVLGLPLDIHGGGPDLKFPHHENEIAQTEGAGDKALANCWMHCGPLMVDSDKMSKSLGNFRTIRQTIARTPAAQSHQAGDVGTAWFNPREAEMLRFFIVRNHYRSAQNYAPDNLIDAQNALDRLYQTLNSVPPAAVADVDWTQTEALAFRAAMDDDFNTAGAVSALFDLAARVNRTSSSEAAAQLKALAGLLGLLQQDPAAYQKESSRYRPTVAIESVAMMAALSAEYDHPLLSMLDDTEKDHTQSSSYIEELIELRSDAKKKKDFSLSDRIRFRLAEKGIVLEDRPGGLTQWRRA